MNYIIFLRGAPGSGKSTLIKNLGLEPYTICPDFIRLLVQSPQITLDGKYGISQKNEAEVWDLVYKLAERRMEQGEVVVVDATFSKTIDFRRFKPLIERYRYRAACLDLSNVPLDVCIKQNKSRADKTNYKFVPEDRIAVIYERFKSQPIPNWVTTFDATKEEDIINFKNFFSYRIHDFSNYNEIHHIGDIHSCFNTLEEVIKTIGHPANNPNSLYIFTGDLLDRGPDPVKTIKFALDIYELSNVIFIYGNHEKWIWHHANNEVIASKEYLVNTKTALDEANIDVKDLRKFYRKLYTCIYYKFHDVEVLVSHGGISTIPDNLVTISSEQLIKGVGGYKDMPAVADSFTKTTKPNQYQIFGHRNIQQLDNPISERNYCLEGQVEFGGELRTVTLQKTNTDNKTTFITRNFKNTQSQSPQSPQSPTKTISDLGKIIQQFRLSKYVKEKKFVNNISSFNFTRETFKKSHWNEQTLRARGIFVDTVTEEIVARSYDKFFNIDENEDSNMTILRKSLAFPINVYKKENGFLGMIGYQSSTDSLIIATKSSLEGPMNELLTSMIYNKFDYASLNDIRRFLKIKKATMVLEAIEPTKDPHVIDYDGPRLYLLDIVYNTLNFSRRPYDKLVDDSKKFDMRVKKLICQLNNWQEFIDWYNKVSSEEYDIAIPVEGYVLEDANNKMLKVKTYYYKFWKMMRHIANRLHSGNVVNASLLYNMTANRFHNWLKNNPEKYQNNINILQLRKEFLTETNLTDLQNTKERFLLT